MSTALTLTEAADRLAPQFDDTVLPSNTPPAKRPSKDRKWLSIDDAGALLAERVTGEPVKARKAKKPEITVKEAAKAIENPKPETSAALAEIRQEREAASAVSWQRWSELEGFASRVVQHFAGLDEMAVLTSPEWQAVREYAEPMRVAYGQALDAEQQAWLAQCAAETEAFEIERPDWTADDARRVYDWLVSLGVSAQELQQLWQTYQPINLDSPVILAIVQAAGFDSVSEALKSAGIDASKPVLLRDHRVQSFIADALDAHQKG